METPSGDLRREALPGLPGQSVASLAFRPDGQQVAYFAQPPASEGGERAHGIEISQYSEVFEDRADYGVEGGLYLDVYNGTVTDMWEWLEIPPFTLYDRLSRKSFYPAGLVGKPGLNGTAFSQDGTYVASGSSQNVFLWSSASGNEISTLSVPGRTVTSLSFKPDGRSLAIGTESGTVLLWDLNLLAPGTDVEPYIEIACSLVNRNFTETEWRQYFGELPQRDTCLNPR